MKRKMFATAVVLVVLATPLFGAQAPSAQSAKAAAALDAQKKAAVEKEAAKMRQAANAAAQKQPAAAAQKPTDKPSTPNPYAPPAAKTAAAAPTPAAATASKTAPAPPKVTSARVNQPVAAPKPAAATPQPASAAKTTPKPSVVPAPKAVPAVATKTAQPKAVPASARPAPAVVKAAPVALSPVQEKLSANKELTREMQVRMPGADVVSAAAGFKDLQQFVSAAHASHNLGMSFDALKAKLLNGKRTSLRQAIQELRPATSAAIEAQRAEYDAIGTIASTQQPAAAPVSPKDPAKVKPAVKTTTAARPTPKIGG